MPGPLGPSLLRESRALSVPEQALCWLLKYEDCGMYVVWYSITVFFSRLQPAAASG